MREQRGTLDGDPAELDGRAGDNVDLRERDCPLRVREARDAP